jgi:hypothetical protein
MTSAAPKPVRSVGAGKANTSGTSKIAAGRRALPTCLVKSTVDDLVQGLTVLSEIHVPRARGRSKFRKRN